MPEYVGGDRSIHYEERGDGFPLLLLAPGAMRSTIGAWAYAAIDPWATFGEFRMVAMDQRNAGASRGPLDTNDPWGAYARDQLGLLDHLAIDRFLVMGCCIGGSFILKLCEAAPERVAGGVLEQPIGVHADNRTHFEDMTKKWGDDTLAVRADLGREEMDAFLAKMWSDDFVVSVPRDTVTACRVPLLVLPGTDVPHPTVTGREIAALAPGAELLEPWKDNPERVAEATEAVRRWLHAHVPVA